MIEDTIESYMIDGKLYVTTSFVSAFFQTDPRNIRNWKKDGLSSKKERGIRQDLFLFNEVYKWTRENIDKGKSRAGKKKKESVEDMMEEPNLRHIDDLSFEEAERRKKIAELKLANIKIAKEEGLLIEADDVDKAMYEQAIMHITKINNDEKIIPILLSLTEEQVKNLKEHNKDHIDLLHSQIEQRFKKDPSNYDIFHEILIARKRGVMPFKMIDEIKKL